MSAEQAEQLHPGDFVWWIDPDSGRCNKVIHIRFIEVIDEVVRISSVTGDTLECFAEELR
jgi:hypothetical protein